jgi:hypothetical protein
MSLAEAAADTVKADAETVKVAEDVKSSEASAEQSGVTTAESPTAGDEGVKKPGSLLDAVDAALAKTAKPAKSPAAEGDTEKKPEEVKTDAEKAEVEAEKGLPFKDHPVWKSSVTERRNLREKNRALQGELDELKGKAGNLDEVLASHELVGKMRGYMSANNLGDDEVDRGFAIMAAMKNDPVRALELLQPYYTALLEVTGNVLSPELQAKVNEGLVDQETAQELARAKAGQGIASAQAERERQQREQRDQAEQAERAKATVQTEAAKVEASWKANDPDYPRKSARIMEKIKLDVLDNGRFASLDDMRTRMAAAKKAVDDEMKALHPTPNAIDPSLPPSAAKKPVVSQPKSVEEAIERGLQLTRRG